MKKNIIKTKKLIKIIKKQISEILQDEKYNKNNDIITITNILIKDNLSTAQIFISTLKNNYIIIKTLNISSRYIRYILSKRIKTKKIPKLQFIYDKNIKNLNKINILLQNV